MNRIEKIALLKRLAEPGNVLRPRNGGTYIEITDKVFEGSTGDKKTLSELQTAPGQISTLPLEIIFDSIEEAAEYYTTATGTRPFTRQTAIDEKIYFSARLYALGPLSVSQALKSISINK
jgi:hypothetical protein